MNRQDIDNKVIKIFSIILNLPLNKLNLKSSPEDIPEWDSLNHIKVIMEIENAFRVEILPEEALEINTILDICKMLYKKLA